jgi:hypothetical protein
MKRIEETKSMEEKLAEALRCGDFASARLCSERLGQHALSVMKAAPDAAARAAAYRHFSAVLSDALHLARVQRAHMSVELNAITGTVRYQQPELERHHWLIQA